MNYKKYFYTSLVATLMATAGASVAWAELPCTSHEVGKDIALASPLLDEVSGLALSHTNEDIFWGHVDSDGAASLYAIHSNGNYVRKVKVLGTNNQDWEDISAGPCPADLDVPDLPTDANGVKRCLYLADTGDNLFMRKDKRIFILPDPVVKPDRSVEQSVEILRTIYVQYVIHDSLDPKFQNPDGESIMVDPRDGVIYTVSKQSEGGNQTLHRIDTMSCGDRTVGIPVPLAEYKFTSEAGTVRKLMNAVTAADFSPDGKHYLVRTYAKIYEYDVTNSSVAQAFMNPSRSYDSSELQGESIVYAANSKDFITAAEAYGDIVKSPYYHYYTCVPAAESTDTPVERNDGGAGTLSPEELVSYLQKEGVDVEAVCSVVQSVVPVTTSTIDDPDTCSSYEPYCNMCILEPALDACMAQACVSENDYCEKLACIEHPETCAPPACEGDDCPCEGEGCDKPACEGDNCPCEGDDCDKPACEGDDCPCEGEGCDKPVCEGDDCPCEGDDCDKPACEGDDCDKPACEGDDCDKPACEGDDCDKPACEGNDCDKPACEGDDCDKADDKDDDHDAGGCSVHAASHAASNSLMAALTLLLGALFLTRRRKKEIK